MVWPATLHGANHPHSRRFGAPLRALLVIFIILYLSGLFYEIADILMAPERKTLVFADVSKHNIINDCWIIISGKVYDVTPFMDEHPGGAEVMLAATGKDATIDYEYVGHSDYAKEMMNKYYIGKIDQSTIPQKHKVVLSTGYKKNQNSDKTQELMVKILKFLVPFMILGLAFTVKAYNTKKI